MQREAIRCIRHEQTERVALGRACNRLPSARALWRQPNELMHHAELNQSPPLFHLAPKETTKRK
jgi:hypothetical protein